MSNVINTLYQKSNSQLFTISEELKPLKESINKIATDLTKSFVKNSQTSDHFYSENI